MSAALLRKSLELVDSSRPSGFTQPNVSKLDNQDRRGGKRKQGENPGPAAIGNSSKRSSKGVAVLSKLTEEEQEVVEENVRRLLMLSSCPAPNKIVRSVIKRTQKAPKKNSKKNSKKGKKEETSVFTDADFNNFSKSYFGQ